MATFERACRRTPIFANVQRTPLPAGAHTTPQGPGGFHEAMAKGGRSSFASWARWTVATAVVSLLQVPHCEGVSARSSVYFDSEVPFTGHGDVTRLLSLLDLTLPGLEAVARHAESDPQTAADELLKCVARYQRRHPPSIC